MFAAVRVRGKMRLNQRMKDTFKMLRLNAPNHCVLLDNNPTNLGMLIKAGSWVTWGEIKNDVLEKLVERRGRLIGDKRLDTKTAKAVAHNILNNGMRGVEIKPVFRLSPPSKGYKSIRADWPKGDLGYRGDKINELLERMI